ncbi:MAG: Holliday junction resolvase RecU [Chloracidobacterium sp.]|uniref:Holliday junction resolvase RecU n=1 Tax=Chloracidobacterium validum TaxID=2821543 RepID=A0ABX8B755_9BACT|nr:Holliday junction resolvase RecU [Chloracidobacterium validum]QUW02783.1 Holliday junction resolvase RecU [Chloracidobacterium validum]
MTRGRQQRGAERGSGFQEAINHTNEAYEKLGRACITRKAIPGKYVVPTNIRRRGLVIPLTPSLAPLKTGATMTAAALQASLVAGQAGDPRAFVPESRGEPDYGGVMAPGGRAIFYDAKTTKRNALDFDNLHPHQVTFLERMAACGAAAGFLVEFAAHQSVFFVPIQVVTLFRAARRRKSIPYQFCAEQLERVSAGRGLVIYDYLTAIERQEARHGATYQGFVNQIKADPKPRRPTFAGNCG